MSSVLNDANAICTSAQLADVLGISTRQVDSLVSTHVLKPVRSSALKLRGKRYRLSAAVQAYLAYREQCVREQSAAGRNGDAYQSARARRMNAIALIEEAKARQLSGEFISRRSAEITVTNCLSAIRNKVLALPNRLSRILAAERDPNTVASILKSHCRGALFAACDLIAEKAGIKNGERETDG